jgi:hypothetical protein
LRCIFPELKIHRQEDIYSIRRRRPQMIGIVDLTISELSAKL